MLLDSAECRDGAWPKMWNGLPLFTPPFSSLPRWMMPPWNDAERVFPLIALVHHERPVRQVTGGRCPGDSVHPCPVSHARSSGHEGERSRRRLTLGS